MTAVAIGSPDKAARLKQLNTYAKVQVWSGYRSDPEVRADVFDAASADAPDEATAQRLTDEALADAHHSLREAAAGWPDVTDFDRLQSAFADLRAGGVVVLEAVDDHWAANDKLTELTAAGKTPHGLAYFTHTDVWHAVENDMLELNVWHDDTANVGGGDDLLGFVLDTLSAHGISSLFDEGRIEATVRWQRRPIWR